MFKGKLLLGVALSITAASTALFAGSEDYDDDGYDNMGYYVYSTDDPNQMPQNDYNSMYVGLQAGANFSQMSYSFTDTNVDTSDNMISTKGAETFAIAGGVIGWGHAWDEFYLGLEGNGRYNFGGGDNDITVFSSGDFSRTGSVDEIHETWSAGLGLRLGGIVYNTALIYGYGGGAYAGFKVNNAVLNSGTNAGSFTQSKFGFSIGAGVEVQMNKAFNIDFRYLYRRFGNLGWSGSLGGDTINTSVTPSDNLIMISGLYHFAV